MVLLVSKWKAGEVVEYEVLKIGHKVLFKCPRCGKKGFIDDDQLHGRVSIDCTPTGCSFHETVNLSPFLKEGT